MKQEDAGLAPPPIDDPDVKKEIVLGLGLRKKQLEKLAKAEKDAGISSHPTDVRLRLHARGIVGNFTEDTEGTMFEAVWPLKQLSEPGDEAYVLTEEDAIKQLMEWDISHTSHDPLAEERWIDKNGKLFQLTLHVRIEATLAPREIKALDDAVAEKAGEGTPTTDIGDKRRQLAIKVVQDAGAMKVGQRERIIEYIKHLEPGSPEFQEFVDAWLDADRSLDMKPLPPKDWDPPVMTEKTYDQLLDDWLEGVGQKITPVARVLLVEWGVPTQYLEVKDDVEGKPRPKMNKSDVEDANTRWTNAVGTQADGDAVVHGLIAARLGKGKSSHLVLNSADRSKLPPTDFFHHHTLCARDTGEGVEQSEVQALDECCKSCVTVHDKAPDSFALVWADLDAGQEPG